MNALTGSPKTSILGIIAGAALLALEAFHPGMTLKQWALAIVTALAMAGTGIAAQDHKAPTTP